MKDVFNNELDVDDEVAFNEPGYAYELKKGVIVKITPKKLVVEWIKDKYNPNHQTYKFPEQLAKNTRTEQCFYPNGCMLQNLTCSSPEVLRWVE